MTHHRQLGCGCGCGGSGGCVTTLSGLGAFPEPAGEINGIATLAHDVQQLTSQLAERWRVSNIVFDRSVYTSLLSRARRRQLTRMTQAESRQLVTGVVGDVGGAIIEAKRLAGLEVTTERQRASNHAAQAALIGPARLMWDSMGEMFRYATVERGAASGLGNPIVVIVAGAFVYMVIAGIAIVALTYLVDSQLRLSEARSEAERLCRRSGGCTPDQYARIRRELAIGPFDGAIQAAGEGVGTAATVVIVAGSAVLAAAAAWGGWTIWRARRVAR